MEQNDRVPLELREVAPKPPVSGGRKNWPPLARRRIGFRRAWRDLERINMLEAKAIANDPRAWGKKKVVKFLCVHALQVVKFLCDTGCEKLARC